VTRRRVHPVMGLALAIAAWPCVSVLGDEGGVSFWVPGQYGSFAAVAPTPGWSLPLVFYNYGGSVSRGVTLQRGHLLSAGLNGSLDGVFVVPTYTADTMVLGARPSFSMTIMPAYTSTAANVSLGQLSASRTDSLFGASDLSDRTTLLELRRT
jgi:hypothetical protein